jgi:hypothetical protein
MPEIGVVHLVRRANGMAPFERFLQSYRAHPAGAEHELLLLFKGFGAAPPAEYESLLAGLPHRALALPDRGYDLEPYFKAAASYEHRYFCFFNSFSRILAPDWLAKLRAPLAARSVGVVSASGSYQSFATGYAERERELATLSLRARIAWRMRHIAGETTFAGRAQRAAAWALGAVGLWHPGRHFPPFPNYHVRTNAFMASREALAGIRVRPLLFKLNALALESGNHGLTMQLLRAGLQPMVVDRQGAAFEKEKWHLSNTFRQSRQEGLLVADNQTETYERADAATRATLCRQAWGEFARPA